MTQPSTKPSPEWLRIAADMIEAKEVKIGTLSTPDELRAGSFLFDEGIFYLGPDGMQQVRAMLIDRYNREVAS